MIISWQSRSSQHVILLIEWVRIWFFKALINITAISQQRNLGYASHIVHETNIEGLPSFQLNPNPLSYLPAPPWPLQEGWCSLSHLRKVNLSCECKIKKQTGLPWYVNILWIVQLYKIESYVSEPWSLFSKQSLWYDSHIHDKKYWVKES